MWSLSKSERGEGVPIVLWPVAIVAILAAIGAGQIGLQEWRTEVVSVPIAGLPPLQEIKAGDLEEIEVDRGDVGDSDLTDREDLVGRVTTAALAKGEPVPEPSVTAAKPSGYGDLVPIAFHADATTAGEVESGERVKLHFAPTVDSNSVEPLTAEAVLLSADESDSGETDYVVAVCDSDRTAMLGVVARARLLVTPLP